MLLVASAVVALVAMVCSPVSAGAESPTWTIGSTVAEADDHVVRQGPHTPMIHDAVEPDEAWDPQTNAIDTGTAQDPKREIVGTYSDYPDFGSGELKYMNSTDGGATFSTGSAAGSPGQVVARAQDGRLIALRRSAMSRAADGRVPMFVVHSATNDFPKTNDGPDFLEGWPLSSPTTGWGLIPTHVSYDRGGQLLMSAYVFPSVAPGKCSGTMIARSIDASASRWQFVGMTSEWNLSDNYYEAGVTRTANGDMLAAIRHQSCNSTPSGYRLLTWRRSTDDGATWTDTTVTFPETWRDGGDIVPGEKDGLDPRIMPRPVLLPNGMLAIHAGRPWNRLAVDHQGGVGSQIAFDTAMITYANKYTNLPADGRIPLKYTSWWNYFANAGSSGNLGIAVTDANRVVTVMDNCHPWISGTVRGDQCNKGDGTAEDHILDEDDNNDLFRRQVDIVTPGVGKLDLPSKVRSGAFKVSTTLQDGYPGQPRTGAWGAVDGSTLPGSGALADTTTPGTYEIAFDRPYNLSKVGLLLGYGLTGSARVQWSDGRTWRSLAAMTDQKGFSLKYLDAKAKGAKAIRVTVDPLTGPSDGWCPQGHATCVLLNEIELYADDVNTFDNDPIGASPRGVEYPIGPDGQSGLQVSTDTNGGRSARVLRIEDSSAQFSPAVTFPASRTGTGWAADISIDVSIPRWDNSVVPVNVLGTTWSGKEISAVVVGIRSDGRIVYRTAGGTWRTIGSFRLPDQDTGWHRLRIVASAVGAVVTIDGTYVGVAGFATLGAVRLGGLQVAAGDSGAARQQVLLDDVQTHYFR